MLTFMAVCAGIITISVVILTAAFLGVAKGLDRTEKETLSALEDLRRAIRTLDELGGRSKAVLHTLETSADAVKDVTARVSRLSSLVLDEAEAPVKNTVALAHGVRAGAESLVGRLLGRRAGG